MKRIRLITIVFAVIVIGALAISIYRTREPRYQGRTLSEWLDSGPIDGDDTEYRLTAGNSVRQIGSDAVPFLLRWAETKDSPLKVKLIYWLNDHTTLHLHHKTAGRWHILAIIGFQFLGSESKPAWPALIHRTYATDWRERRLALDCLFGAKPDKETFLPVLIRLIHDPERVLQKEAAYDLHLRYPQDAEATGVYKMFPSIKDISRNLPSTNQPPAK